MIALTDVDVVITEWLSPKPARVSGALMTITVVGGVIRTTLTKEQAWAVGVTEVVEKPRTPTKDNPADFEEVELAASGPIDDFVWGHSPGVAMAEGDRVVLFLIDHTVPGYAESATLDMLTTAHPSAVLHRAGDRWTEGTKDGPQVDVHAAVRLLAG